MKRKGKAVRPDIADSSTWYTRGDLAKLLKRSRQGVMYLEQTGHLHPIIDERGRHRFDPREVDRYVYANAQRLAERKDMRGAGGGELAALAFSMFAGGRGRRDIVVSLKITPEDAQRLYEEWRLDSFEEAHLKREQEEISKAIEERSAQRRAEHEKRMERFSRLVAAFGKGS